MKLILCAECADVLSISMEKKLCQCKKSWGQYHDEINATYGGKAIPLGFDNSSFVSAVRRYGGGDFLAFVVGSDSKTFKEEYND